MADSKGLAKHHKLKVWYLAVGGFAVAFILGVSLVLPFFDKHHQVFVDDAEETNVKEKYVDRPFLYDDISIPSNSFGVNDFVEKSVNWKYIDNNTKYSLMIDDVDSTDILFINYTDTFEGRKYSYEFVADRDGFSVFTISFNSQSDDCYIDEINNTAYFNYSNGEQLFYDFNDLEDIKDVVMGYSLVNGFLNITLKQDISKGMKVVYDPTFGGTGDSGDTFLHRNTGACYMWGVRGKPVNGDGTVSKISVKFGTLASTETYMCSLYAYTDNSSSYAGTRIANTSTVQVADTADNTIVDFSFVSPPSVTNNTYYYLVVTQTTETGTTSLNYLRYVDLTPTIVGFTKTATTPLSFDSPLTSESSTTRSCYILATYTPTVPNSAPVITANSQNPKNLATGVGFSLVGNYSHFNISVTDVNDASQNMNITWRTNESGTWKTMGTNTSINNGTYYCNNVSWVDQYSHKYWWNVSLNDGCGGWDNETYFFTTSSIPDITINFAGNLSDSGGPYWQPPDETTVLSGVWSDGYYTNDSMQSEDWIYINCTITDATSVHLDWLNGTSWTNGTYHFNDRAGDYWDINTSSLIFNIHSGYKYSFNVNATFSDTSKKIVWWNKTGIDGSYTRRYVHLNYSSLTNISYTPFYFYKILYDTPALNKYDVLRHDSGTDGSTDDTGGLNLDIPTSVINERSCSNWVVYWFDEDICIQPTIVKNIYYRFWASSNSTIGATSFLYGISKQVLAKANLPLSNPISTIYYDNGNILYNHTYNLRTKYFDITDYPFTDNNITEFFLQYQVTRPSVISNRSFISCIFLNVPDNATLNSTGDGDSDNDGLSDWTELYVTFTLPNLVDTDNDNIDDFDEIVDGTDPNNYTDYDLPQWINIVNYNGSICNSSSYHIISSWNGSLFNISGWYQVSLWNGSIYNSSSYHIISSWNGSIFNATVPTVIHDFNGSIYNSSSYHIVSSWNGSIFNNAVFNLVQDWNGSIFNQSVFNLIQNWNGTIFNTSNYFIINNWNGSIYNTSNYNLINTWNGSIYNSSSFIQVNLWNGSIFNATVANLIQDWNGSLFNISGWYQVSSWNGTIFNASSYSIVSSWNGSILNQSSYSQINLWNGSIFNSTIFTIVQEWNGTIYNTSSFIQVNLWNGSIFNSSSYNIISSWNGSIFNVSIPAIVNNWNGSIYNSSEFSIISLFNGSIYNASAYMQINLWNGTIFNASSFYLMQDYNGTIYNSSDYIQINLWNGTIYNASSYNQISLWNGSIYNSSSFVQVALWNGSIFNSSVPTIIQDWNGSIFNSSSYYIINSWNGSVFNSSSWVQKVLWNGTIYNSSDEWINIQTWNGTLFNISSWIQSVLWNGSIFNSSIFNQVDLWNGTIWNGTGANIVNLWNGSIFNSSIYHQIYLWNGTIFNTSSYVLIQSWNGSIFNVSSWVQESVWNGSIFNSSDEWISIQNWNGTIFNSSGYSQVALWNGSIWNGTGANIINTWNGSIFNLSIPTVIQDWNGTIFNSSSYALIQSWNGSIYNVSISTQVNLWNGSLYNTSLYMNIQTWNGSIFNTSVLTQISLWNGSIFNITSSSLINDWNGSIWNGTGANIINLWNGSIFNFTIDYINISDVHPVNGSSNNPVLPILYFVVNHTIGNIMNVSVYAGINSTVMVLLNTYPNIFNSTISLIDTNATAINTVYYWRVAVDDGIGHSLNETYHFNTNLNASVLSINMVSRFPLGLGVGIVCMIPFIVLVVMKRRRKKRIEVKRETFTFYRR